MEPLIIQEIAHRFSSMHIRKNVKDLPNTRKQYAQRIIHSRLVLLSKTPAFTQSKITFDEMLHSNHRTIYKWGIYLIRELPYN